jgi:hypothetical protein
MLRFLEVEFLNLFWSCIAVSSICDAPFCNMCSAQADINSRKLRLLVSLFCPRPDRFVVKECMQSRDCKHSCVEFA